MELVAVLDPDDGQNTSPSSDLTSEPYFSWNLSAALKKH